MLNRAELAKLIDHTLLKPETTIEMLARHCQEAAELDVFAVCVLPTHVKAARGMLPPRIKVATVAGFPTGAIQGELKVIESALAIENGADEIDVVMNIGAARDHDWKEVERELQLVRGATNGALLKVIVESAVLTNEELCVTMEIIEHIGAEQAKTSTGTHPAGGATVEAVTLMRAHLSPNVQIKASGGIRTLADAQKMVDAGAARLGMSATRAILDELEK